MEVQSFMQVLDIAEYIYCIFVSFTSVSPFVLYAFTSVSCIPVSLFICKSREILKQAILEKHR